MQPQCPHCGASLPPTRDAFCPNCFQGLDEPTAAQRGAERTEESEEDARARARARWMGAAIGVALVMTAGLNRADGVPEVVGTMVAAVMVGVVGWFIGDAMGQRR